MKKILILVLVFIAPLKALANGDALIKGFAKFQAGRVENIVLNNVVDDIEQNEYFKKLFNKTSNAVSNYNGIQGKQLIPLMQHFIKQDIDNFQIFSKCVIRLLADVEEKGTKHESYDSIKKYFTGDNNQNNTVNTFIYSKCDNDDIKIEELVISFVDKEKVNALTNILSMADKSKSNYVAMIAKTIKDDKCVYSNNKINSKISDNCLTKLKENIKTSSQLKINSIKGKLETLVLAVDDKEDTLINDLSSRKTKFLNGLREYLSALGCEYEDKLSCEDNMSYYVKMHYLITAFEMLGFNQADKYNSFKKKALFLASLTDAAKANSGSNGDEVASIIKSYVSNENEAFFEKRQGVGFVSSYCSFFMCTHDAKFVISSYFGAAFKVFDSENDNIGSKAVPYGPIGIEFRLANFWGRPLSIGYAPFDLGSPISNELRDKTYTAEFEDIRSDNIYLSFSFKSKPFSIMFSKQKNRINSSGEKEDVKLISLVFDLPLYAF
jgi:hypothetical protein